MEKLTPKFKWILANNHKINGLEESELIEEDSPADGDKEQAELGHDHSEVVDAEDLGGDDTADAHRGDPHDDADHPHDHLVNDGKELDNSSRFLSERTKDSSKRQTEEDYSKSISSISKYFIKYLNLASIIIKYLNFTYKSILWPLILGQIQFQPAIRNMRKFYMLFKLLLCLDLICYF